jgi:glycosyltransferase involved in cell wall biosynthesis
MRLLSITAGAGAMYCGSCFRDNALAAELKARGHDVSLMPVYTPTLTDEPNVSDHRVFFGGISVYLQQHVPLFRHTPAILDRMWDAPAVLRTVAGRSLSAVDPRFLGAMTVSMLRGEDGFQGKEIVKLVEFLRGQPPFDLIVLPNSLLLGLAPPLARALGRPVCCTLQGEDHFLEGLPAGDREESLRLIRSHRDSVARFIAVSDFYADHMAGYLDLPRARIRTVPIGIHVADDATAPPAPRPPASGPRPPFTVGFFARMAPEKGLHLLAEAYALMRRDGRVPAGRLEAAGYLAPEHHGYLEKIEAGLAAAGLAAEFRYHGALDREAKIRFLRTLDVASVPSPYAEPKGMSVLEALGCGTPVVQPRHGAFPEVLARTGGGLLFTPGDVAGLAAAIVELHDDPYRRKALGEQGARGVRREYSVGRMAERALEVYDEAIREAAPAAAPA